MYVGAAVERTGDGVVAAVDSCSGAVDGRQCEVELFVFVCSTNVDVDFHRCCDVGACPCVELLAVGCDAVGVSGSDGSVDVGLLYQTAPFYGDAAEKFVSTCRVVENNGHLTKLEVGGVGHIVEHTNGEWVVGILVSAVRPIVEFVALVGICGGFYLCLNAAVYIGGPRHLTLSSVFRNYGKMFGVRPLQVEVLPYRGRSIFTHEVARGNMHYEVVDVSSARQSCSAQHGRFGCADIDGGKRFAIIECYVTDSL